MQGLVVRGLTFEEIWNVDINYVKVTAAKIQVKVTAISTLRRSTLQGLMVVGLIVEEISNVNAKCVKVTGAQHIGQGHLVKVPAESVHLGEALCKVW